MCVAQGATLQQVETTPTAMRKSRALVPKGSEWVEYEAAKVRSVRQFSPAPEPIIHAMRWRLVTRAPFPETLGLLATDRLRWQTIQTLKGRNLAGAEALHGHIPAAAPTMHGHAHWLWVGGGEQGGSPTEVRDLVVWVPDGVSSSLLTSMVGKRLEPPRWAPRGFVAGDLALVGFGGREIIDDLGADSRSRRWESVTPFLMTRHLKPKRDFNEVLAEDLALQLKYRLGDDAPSVVGITVHSDRSMQARAFRQDRIGVVRSAGREADEALGPHRRPRKVAGGDNTVALYLAVEFSEPVRGPLLLGRLSHFGFGRFTPSL